MNQDRSRKDSYELEAISLQQENIIRGQNLEIQRLRESVELNEQELLSHEQ